jgi:hypothetical protein
VGQSAGGGGLGATGRGLPGQTVAEEFADVPQLVQLLVGEVVQQAGLRAVRVPGGGFLQCVLSGPGELGEVDAAVCRACQALDPATLFEPVGEAGEPAGGHPGAPGEFRHPHLAAGGFGEPGQNLVVDLRHAALAAQFLPELVGEQACGSQEGTHDPLCIVVEPVGCGGHGELLGWMPGSGNGVGG